jgi:ligand-binding sensor domain-containing protein
MADMWERWMRLYRKIFTTTTLVLIIATLSAALVEKASAYYNIDWSNSSVPME